MSRRAPAINPQPLGVGGIGRQYDVYPLHQFPVDHQYRIALAVMDDTKPPSRIIGELFSMPSRAWFEWHWQRGIDPDGQRRPIPSALRARVYERDGHACLHCGVTEDLSLDHIYPFSLGGRETFENLQTLCRSCNSRKGARVDA